MGKNIYDMKLHQCDRIQDPNGNYTYRVTRVPGGWLYENCRHETEVFVPFNNEFQDGNSIGEGG